MKWTKIPMEVKCALLLLLPTPVLSMAQTASDSFAYVLQADALGNTKAHAVEKLASCGRDWIVLDAVFGSDEPWTKADLDVIRAGRPGRKVIAYLSIGEAEDYRPYWHREWGHGGKRGTGAPSFLLAENPEWKGNYRVKYWDPAWQKIILTEVDRIMAAGFDGIYLDIVDGFETFERNGKNFEDNKLNPETKQSYRRDMVDWVKTVAARAHKTNPIALVIPQNGAQLLASPDFVQAVDAIGIEDLFTEGDQLQPAPHSAYIEECVHPLMAARKPVLDIEYAKAEGRQTLAREKAHQHGFVWLITDRPLKGLGDSGR